MRKLRNNPKAQREALEHNIKIRTLGFGWKQFKINWTVKRQKQKLENLEAMLEIIVVEEKKLTIPTQPYSEVNKRADCPILGTMTDDCHQLDAKHFKTEQVLHKAVMKLSKEMNKRNNENSMYAG